MTALPTVGFMGLGRMGSPMAARIAAAGYPLVVWNRTSATSGSFASRFDAEFSDRPIELARRCDVLITMLSDGAALADVYLGGEGLLKEVTSDKTCVDMGTSGPEAVYELSQAVLAQGARFVDAPVSGSVAMAEAGELTIMAGGEADVVEQIRPVLATMGSTIFYMGSVGSGATIKLATNVIVYGLSQALSEALVLAELAGIPREQAYNVFASSAVAAPFVHYRRNAFLSPEAAPVMFRMALAHKDLDLALSLAEKVGASLPQSRTNMGVIADAITDGFGDHDMSAVAKHLRSSSGPEA